jgi:hypothetical protein
MVHVTWCVQNYSTYHVTRKPVSLNLADSIAFFVDGENMLWGEKEETLGWECPTPMGDVELAGASNKISSSNSR